MQYKYVLKPKKTGPSNKQGRYSDPNCWKTGPDPLRREKYYAYLKHKAQCNFRKQEYELSWEQWESLWPDDLFLKRGRGCDNLCLTKIDYELPWALYNVQVVTKGEHLKRNGEFRNG